MCHDCAVSFRLCYECPVSFVPDNWQVGLRGWSQWNIRLRQSLDWIGSRQTEPVAMMGRPAPLLLSLSLEAFSAVHSFVPGIDSDVSAEPGVTVAFECSPERRRRRSFVSSSPSLSSSPFSSSPFSSSLSLSSPCSHVVSPASRGPRRPRAGEQG